MTTPMRLCKCNLDSTLFLQEGQIESLDWLLEHGDMEKQLQSHYAKRSLLHQSAKFGQVNRIVLDSEVGTFIWPILETFFFNI